MEIVQSQSKDCKWQLISILLSVHLHRNEIYRGSSEYLTRLCRLYSGGQRISHILNLIIFGHFGTSQTLRPGYLASVLNK